MWRDDPVGTALSVLEAWYRAGLNRLDDSRLVERGQNALGELLASVPSRVPTGLPAGYPQSVSTGLVALTAALIAPVLAYTVAYIVQGRSVRNDAYAVDRWLLGLVHGAKRRGPLGIAWALVWPLRTLVWIASWPVRVLLRAVWWLTVGSVRSLVRRTGTDSFTARIALGGMIASGVIAGLGVLYLATADLSINTSSAPVIIGFFDLITNPWVYVIAAILLLRVQLFMLDKVLAWRTARETGYSYRTVRLLAEEAKKPDLQACTRVLAQTGDSVDKLEQWILDGFDGDGHDVPDIEADDAATTPVDEPPEFDDTDTGSSDAERRQEDLPLMAQFALMRNDLAAAFDIESWLWRFGVPFAVTFLAQLLLVRIWVQVWLYGVMLAISTFIGATYYFVTDFRYRRRLRGLRAEPNVRRRSDCSLLVKAVDTPETTMYYLFAAGNAYASPDRERLAQVGAEIGIDILEGRRPRPAIEERYARLLTQYVPNLEKWTENREKPAIADRLVNVVSDAPEYILPQNVLIEQVVEHDRRRALYGLIPVGLGHDVDLVRDVYRDLVERHALVEDPVTVETPDGEDVEVAAVSRGDQQLAPRVLKVRSKFSTWFQRYRDTRYDVEPVRLAPNVQPFRAPETREETSDQRTVAGGD